MTQTRIWLGHVQPGREAEHRAFVAWLNTPEAAGFFARYLDGYRLREADGRIEIAMRADEPLDFIRFLRLARLWPEFWVYEGGGAGAAGLGPDAVTRVDWSRPVETPAQPESEAGQ